MRMSTMDWLDFIRWYLTSHGYWSEPKAYRNTCQEIKLQAIEYVSALDGQVR